MVATAIGPRAALLAQASEEEEAFMIEKREYEYDLHDELQILENASLLESDDADGSDKSPHHSPWTTEAAAQFVQACIEASLQQISLDAAYEQIDRIEVQAAIDDAEAFEPLGAAEALLRAVDSDGVELVVGSDDEGWTIIKEEPDRPRDPTYDRPRDQTHDRQRDPTLPSVCPRQSGRPHLSRSMGRHAALAVVARWCEGEIRASEETLAMECARLELQLEAARRERREEVESKACVICLERPKEVALLPCAHLCLCSECTTQMQSRGELYHCPCCRAEVDEVRRIYDA
jgi:hypothetical protein|tara:strand:- start:459 stop:1328 length:870 start_codon:yes stop_codon:yes gene_type:complete